MEGQDSKMCRHCGAMQSVASLNLLSWQEVLPTVLPYSPLHRVSESKSQQRQAFQLLWSLLASAKDSVSEWNDDGSEVAG